MTWGNEAVIENDHAQPALEVGEIDPGAIQLAGDCILVRIDPPEEVTRSKRLHIPDIAQTQHGCYMGTVLGVGPGKRSLKRGERIPNSVKLGNRILFAWNGRELAQIQKGYDIIRDGDIYAVLETKRRQKPNV